MPGDDAAARLSADDRAPWLRTIPQPPGRLRRRQLVSSHIRSHDAVILRFEVMVRSVLRVVQGHETRSHADLTDRDRDESSRRAISAWVRTNPQTQVR